MYLKRMELQGFKSFANRTELEFKPGITAIIGPNGSGKSNISDAMRWVLGEQSMKALRSAKSEDIIFAGTENRKSLGFAEVSIVLDNEDNSLPIEYTEVTVTRRIYRTGETGFFINKVPCRLKDITELFMDTGIGKDGYSIIGQGRIDEILSTKSEDRRHIFEEAAGIVKYRTRREESEKKLEQTKINLMRINDILSELEANLEPLKAQRDKAMEFLSLKEELKSIEVGLYLYKIENFKGKLEELQNNMDILNNQNKDEEEKLQNVQALKEEIKSTIDSINERIEKLQNISFESKNEIEKINSNINISNERITNNNANKNRLENEITDSNKNIIELEEEKKNKESKRVNLLTNKEKYAKELKEKEEELSKLTEKLSTKQLQIEEKKKQNEELTEKKYEMQNQITAFDTNIENYKIREKQEHKEIEKIISELDEKRTSKNEIVSEVNRIQTQRNNNKLELEKIQTKKDEIDKKTKEYEELIVNLTDEKRIKTSRYNFLVETEREKEGYAKSVKDLLVACEKDVKLKKGINGVLANIISTNEKYQTAIEMALGASLQNIVTDTDEDAKKMIEYLRSNKLGRASFLPVSAIKGKKLDSYVISDGIVGIASDLVKADKKYENIVLNLLGRTLIAENIEAAIKIAKANKYYFKIVTLEGDIINPSGAMTGGSLAKKTVNLLGRTAEIKRLENRIKEIDLKLEKVVTEKEQFLKENENIINQITEKTDLLQKSEVELAKVNEKKNSIEAEISKIVSNKEKCEINIKILKEQIQNAEEEKQKVYKDIEKIEQEIESLTNEINEYTKLNSDEQKYINDLNSDITDLKISISSFDESNTSIDEIVQRINFSIENEKKEIERKKEEIIKLGDQNVELEKTIEELKQSIEKINEEVLTSTERLEELKTTRNEKNEKLDRTEKEIAKQFEIIQHIKEGIIKVESKKSATNQDLEEVINELWNDYEITPNNAMEKFEKPINIQETQKNVNELHSKIRDLGSVNVDAIEEYKKAEERYNTMNEQRLDLETTLSKLKGVIQDMTKTMKEQFKEKFKLIQKNFNEVFVELFGGGRAELILENEENILESGIEIVVQPTGKKLNNLLQLSGGERALTAIALLFAILKINPSPFCILDEIEAALDDVNVYRYAEYLKKFSKETQFLIITHRKGSMEAASTVYGITMEENGISKMLSINLGK